MKKQLKVYAMTMAVLLTALAVFSGCAWFKKDSDAKRTTIQLFPYHTVRDLVWLDFDRAILAVLKDEPGKDALLL